MSVAVYAIGRAVMREWAAATLGEAVIVEDPATLAAQPPGTCWLCVSEDVPVVRAARPDDACFVVRPAPAVHWSSLAHDIRGPVGVIQGALAELSSDDPMIPLAQRALGRLVHHAACWDALDAEVSPERIEAAGLLEDARAELASLEPRRAEKVVVSDAPATVVADPVRLRLGLVRLLAHLTRVSRDEITLSAPMDSTIRIHGAPPPDLSPEAAADRSSRLAMAIALLTPITDRWEHGAATLEWRARAH